MKYLDLNLDNINKDDFNFLISSFKLKKVIAIPTDTIYGLSCLASDRRAVRRIYRIKKRDYSKPLLILVSSINMAKRYAYISDSQEKKLKELWFSSSRPTTVILRSKSNLPLELNSIDGGIAIRLPKSEFLTKMIKRVGGALVSTSLNVSGEEDINDWKEIKEKSSLNKVDYFVRVNKKIKKSKVSQIIDLRFRKIKIARK